MLILQFSENFRGESIGRWGPEEQNQAAIHVNCGLFDEFPTLDSNQDRMIQSHSCYRYTSGEYWESASPDRNRKFQLQIQAANAILSCQLERKAGFRQG